MNSDSNGFKRATKMTKATAIASLSPRAYTRLAIHQQLITEYRVVN